MSFKITWEDVKEEADFSPIEEKFLLEEIPQKNISFSNEKSENIMIEGDNYPVLKLMQKKSISSTSTRPTTQEKNHSAITTAFFLKTNLFTKRKTDIRRGLVLWKGGFYALENF